MPMMDEFASTRQWEAVHDSLDRIAGRLMTADELRGNATASGSPLLAGNLPPINAQDLQEKIADREGREVPYDPMADGRPWVQLSADEKIERMRMELRRTCRDLDKLKASFQALKFMFEYHRHTGDGTAVVSVAYAVPTQGYVPQAAPAPEDWL